MRLQFFLQHFNGHHAPGGEAAAAAKDDLNKARKRRDSIV
jgi:hypothetical protein